MDRPIGVTVICALNLLAAAALIFSGAVLLTLLDSAGKDEVLRRMPTLTAFDFVALRTLLIVLIGMGFAMIILSIALWSGSTIAWWIFMISVAFVMVKDFSAAMTVVQSFAGGKQLGTLEPETYKAVIRWGVNLVAFFYMLMGRPLGFFNLHGRHRIGYALGLLAIGFVLWLGVPSPKQLIAAKLGIQPATAGADGQSLTDGWLLPTQPIHIVCSKDVRAYDVQDFSKRIGTFKAGSSLEILAQWDKGDINEMKYKIRFIGPNNQVVDAICEDDDLMGDLPSGSTFTSIPSSKPRAPNVEELAHSQILSDPLFGGHSWNFVLRYDITAYSRTPPYAKIGIFKKGTDLACGNPDAQSGMTAVACVQDGKVISAFCKTADVPTLESELKHSMGR